ncbi:HAD-IIA family hydrolase [Hoeflea prorocentri]|uniref:HAD hydrolase-like protein n=1 Tax=Hoeflea prorocentri TaxID=1922333 RepID=A0A9X3ZIM3_9HYPH|nr:HAD hydrolase-like protein [Hoeflea prorocentri]MCY6382168.1 HAD hydrolase-like protein [Hoeflea prorocentri]MDA5399968.1 HAD hydrolase-like protein [Hoeflea prorocentri]
MSSHTTVLLPRSKTTGQLSVRLCADAAAVLCDLDGCLASENRAFEDAPAFVETCGDRLWIVSNNSTDTAASLSEKLDAIGLTIPAERILLAGEQTLRHLAASQPAKGISLYAGHDLQTLKDELQPVASNDPGIVLLCRDLEFKLATLDRLVADIDRGAELWVSNTDVSHPGIGGRPIPETGALLAALQAIRSDTPYRCIGKPDPYLLRQVLRKSATVPGDAVFVGDNALTDGCAAKSAGIDFVHLVRGGDGR